MITSFGVTSFWSMLSGFSFDSFTFHWPYFAILFFLPPVAYFFLKKVNTSDLASQQKVRFPNINRLNKIPNISQSTKDSSSIFYRLLLSIFWIGLTFALMRPQIVNVTHHVQEKGYDIMLAVDISESMIALDMASSNDMYSDKLRQGDTRGIKAEELKSRIVATKEVVSNFIRMRGSDRVGLILFGQYAYLQVPVTRDALMVERMLNNAAAGMAGGATAIGDAIGIAIKEMQKGQEGAKVLILLTDGDDNSSTVPPLQAAMIAKDNNLKIYTIGIGKNGMIPYPDGRGGVVLGQSNMNEETLKQVAEITGGVYFRAEDDYSLQKIYQKINELEKRKYNETEYSLHEPLFRVPLLVALLSFLLIGLVPLIKTIIRRV